MSQIPSPLDLLFQRGLNEGLLSGMVLAVGNTRQTLVTRAFGTTALPPDGHFMPADAIFDMASVTKVIATTSACARCIDRGWLDPDAPANQYLPRLAQLPGQPITVRALATHTSGFDNKKIDHLPIPDARESLLATPPQWAPGSRFEYSCRNFILLGWIVEQRAGLPLATFCDREIFQPLGMTDTRFGPLDSPGPRVVPTYVAPGIISDEQARHLPQPIGNAGLFSCAEDLGRFCRTMLEARRNNRHDLFASASLAWLTRPCSPPGLPQRAFGWDMRTRAEIPHRPSSFSPVSFGHSGWTGQSLWIDPILDRYVIVLTNRTAIPGNAATHATQMVFRGEVADQLLAESL